MIWIARLLYFLLPFLFFWLWLRWRERRGAEVTDRVARIVLISIFAIWAVFGGFLLFGVVGGAPPNANYVPAEMRDGKIVPGHYEPQS
jgi:Family of unknown function (DUF6111)